MSVIDEIQAERTYQAIRGYTPDHDDQHTDGSLIHVASDILAQRYDRWGIMWTNSGDKRRQLIIAAALIAAEIERMDRANKKGGAS